MVVLMLETKICGLSTPDAIDAVVQNGGEIIGFIFFEKSPRHIDLDTAARLAKHTAGRVQKVAVTVNADDAYLDSIVEAAKPEMLQLHGAESLERVEEVKARYGLPVMKAFAIRSAEDFDKLGEYEGIVDRFLFDAKPPKGSELPGGNGVSFDWSLLQGLDIKTPYMLSGGLSADNLSEAVSQSGAKAIDISSGVESSPGVKNLEMIAQLLATASKIRV